VVVVVVVVISSSSGGLHPLLSSGIGEKKIHDMGVIMPLLPRS